MRFSPVGRCIYCGATKYSPENNRPLAEEHIIPFALDGTWILPEASCKKCEALTANAEVKALRGVLWGARVALGMRSRKGHPKLLPMYAHANGHVMRVDLPISSYPSLLMLCAPAMLPQITTDYDLSPGASLFCLAMPLTDIPMNLNPLEFAVSDDPPQKVAEPGRDGVTLPPLNVKAYFRMVAKIAHSYAVAMIGLDAFEPFLLDIIKGKADEEVCLYIGGPTEHSGERMKGALHAIRFQVEHFFDGRRYFAVELKLFAFLGGPSIYVIVGELT